MNPNTDKTPEYKEAQRKNKQRMANVYTGPEKDGKKAIIAEGTGIIYGWDKTGIKRVGVQVAGHPYAILREPANKKEKRKMLAGESYRDKKGKVAKDIKPEPEEAADEKNNALD